MDMKTTSLTASTLEDLVLMGIDEILLPHTLNRFDAIEETLGFVPAPESVLDVKASLVVASPPPLIKRSEAPLVSLKQAQSEAMQSAQDAKTLDELRAAVEAFDGCALKFTANTTVFGDGNPKAKVMLVGEAPGADEDRVGLPFVGLSGQLLDKMFAAIGLNRKDSLYISNILPWRPPGNRQPTPDEASACLPFIRRHIELVAPDYVIAVGGTAAKTLFNTRDGIMSLRGRFRDYTSEGLEKTIKSIAIFHPAYLLRSPGQKREVWKDLLLLQKSLSNQPPI